MVLFSAKTGLVEAVLLDNGYLTDVRTAAAGAVAAKWLAREDASKVGIVGAGVQARLQLQALALVRDIAEARVWARDTDKAAAYAARMEGELGIAVTPSADVESLVGESDIVVTTTPSKTPLIEAAWLHPGLHVTAMGSDDDYKTELAPGVLAAADIYVCDRQSQCAVLGELHHAVAAGVVAPEASFPELGQIIAGQKDGRTDAAQVTVCDLTGTGVQDTAIATLARQRAEAKGAGTTIQS
jgi:ornithine cyclodeaminase